mgnify:CR=1 FL=1
MPPGIYPRKSVDQRFWEKVDKNGSNGCWVWGAWTNERGYGLFSPTHRDKIFAHRWAYENINGPIPEGYQLDHLCRNRICVNPAHLEVVTPQQNTLRGQSFAAVNARKTHCPQGHPYDLFNTSMHFSGRRRCRACWRVKAVMADARAGLKAAVQAAGELP